jgi:hypothetical protein
MVDVRQKVNFPSRSLQHFVRIRSTLQGHDLENRIAIRCPTLGHVFLPAFTQPHKVVNAEHASGRIDRCLIQGTSIAWPG